MQTGRSFYRYTRPYPSQRLVFEEELVPADVATILQISVDTVSTGVIGSASEVLVAQAKAQTETKETKEARPANLPPDYSIITGLSKTKLPGIAERLASITAQVKELKKEEEELKTLGASILIKAKVKSVMVGDIRVTQTGGQSKSIKRDLLLKYGVKESVIEKATVLGQPWTSLKVTVRSSDGNGNGDEGEE